MNPIEPRVCPSGHSRIVFAKDQPEYEPLPAVVNGQGDVITEWELTAEELADIMNGGTIKLSIWTFGRPLQPIRLEVNGPILIRAIAGRVASLSCSHTFKIGENVELPAIGARAFCPICQGAER